MAAKTSWHRYGTKLRHCPPIYEFVFTESPGWVEVVTFQSIQSAVSYLVSHRLSPNKPSLRTVSNRFLVPCSFSQFLGFVCTFCLSARATCPVMEAPLCGLAGRCRISPPRFLAECCKRQLNHGSFVLLYFRLSTFLSCIEFVYLYFPVLFCLSVSVNWLAVKMMLTDCTPVSVALSQLVRGHPQGLLQWLTGRSDAPMTRWWSCRVRTCHMLKEAEPSLSDKARNCRTAGSSPDSKLGNIT